MGLRPSGYDPTSRVQGLNNSEPQNRRISNIECRRAESLRSIILKRKYQTINSILISKHWDLYTILFLQFLCP